MVKATGERLRRQRRQNITPMAVVGAWIPRAMVAELDELAAEAGMARSYFLAKAISEYVSKHTPGENPRDRVE
jgi:metal-responsive CopG/Arc/MetJ family transcriptional regulator